LEKVTPSVLISTIYFAGVKSKTIELQREIYDKFNVQEYPKLGFGTDMSSMDFQNFLWIMNNCSPKEINPEIAKNVKENSKGSVNAEFFINGNEIMNKKYNGAFPWRQRT
jgi:hypothetical protein